MSEEVASVFSTLKRTIRLSCLASSQHYLVLGAQTGSLYFFERFSFKFLQLIIFEDLNEPISLVSFAPDERLLAFATASPSRNIYLVSLPVRTRRKKVRSMLFLLCLSGHCCIQLQKTAICQIFTNDFSFSTPPPLDTYADRHRCPLLLPCLLISLIPPGYAVYRRPQGRDSLFALGDHD